MAEALIKKKRIRAGHKGSSTKTVHQITETLGGDTPDRDRLSLLRITLKEKLDTIKTLDAEIVDLIDDEGELADEIEQADAYPVWMHSEGGAIPQRWTAYCRRSSYDCKKSPAYRRSRESSQATKTSITIVQR